MASSGTITLTTQSVDYNGGGPYTRGHITLTNIIGWNVNDSGDISFNLISSSDNAGGYWYICWSSYPYYVDLVLQVSYDGGSSWSTLAMKQQWIDEECGYGQANTIAMSTNLINQLGTYHLTGNCSIRFLYYMESNPTPGPVYEWAFPNESYSEASQVPVVVDVSWTATLKYNANGGTGAPSNQTHTQTGNSYTFTVSNTVPTRTNHRFEGWATTSSASTPSYHGGDSYTINKSDPTKTLYAVWTKYYRPGATLYSANEYYLDSPVWYSNDKTNGACHIRTENAWQEMRTIDGTSDGQGNPPLIYRNDSLYNQKKLGKS